MKGVTVGHSLVRRLSEAPVLQLRRSNLVVDNGFTYTLSDDYAQSSSRP
jgi:hypothetical protein